MDDDPTMPVPARTVLPAGTVTFLFTDIEGSTRLLQQLRDGYAPVRAEHHRILREAAGGQGGREVDTQGDAFFFVFARARDAVVAAATAQRELAVHAWPDGVEVRVRMGLHTGEPAVGDEGYVGIDVVKAARICAAAHGGQVLLSQTTRALIAGDEPEGTGLLNVGEHRLKDLDRREPLFQLVLAGLPTRFERPRTLDEQPDEPTTMAVVGGRDLAGQVEAAVRDLKTSIEQQVADNLRAAGIKSVADATSIPGVHRPMQRSEAVLAAFVVTVVFGALAAVVIAILVLLL